MNIIEYKNLLEKSSWDWEDFYAAKIFENENIQNQDIVMASLSLEEDYNSFSNFEIPEYFSISLEEYYSLEEKYLPDTSRKRETAHSVKIENGVKKHPAYKEHEGAIHALAHHLSLYGTSKFKSAKTKAGSHHDEHGIKGVGKTSHSGHHHDSNFKLNNKQERINKKARDMDAHHSHLVKHGQHTSDTVLHFKKTGKNKYQIHDISAHRAGGSDKSINDVKRRHFSEETNKFYSQVIENVRNRLKNS